MSIFLYINKQNYSFDVFIVYLLGMLIFGRFMLQQGKHAKITSTYPFKRILKTYKNSYYAQNEFQILNLLEKANILNLNHILESENTFSMDKLDVVYITDTFWSLNKATLIPNLAYKIKSLHTLTKLNYGYYINHNDLFKDNIVIDTSSDRIILIDWGLASKSWSIYPDVASALIGVLNDTSTDFLLFIKTYFEDINLCNPKLLSESMYPLIKKYYEIRKLAKIETTTLDLRYNNAKLILKDIFNYE